MIQSLLAWAKNHVSITRVGLEVFSNNQPAIRLYERLGFVSEGVKRNAVAVNGKLIDVVQMAWLKEQNAR